MLFKLFFYHPRFLHYANNDIVEIWQAVSICETQFTGWWTVVVQENGVTSPNLLNVTICKKKMKIYLVFYALCIKTIKTNAYNIKHRHVLLQYEL